MLKVKNGKSKEGENSVVRQSNAVVGQPVSTPLNIVHIPRESVGYPYSVTRLNVQSEIQAPKRPDSKAPEQAFVREVKREGSSGSSDNINTNVASTTVQNITNENVDNTQLDEPKIHSDEIIQASNNIVEEVKDKSQNPLLSRKKAGMISYQQPQENVEGVVEPVQSNADNEVPLGNAALIQSVANTTPQVMTITYVKNIPTVSLDNIAPENRVKLQAANVESKAKEKGWVNNKTNANILRDDKLREQKGQESSSGSSGSVENAPKIERKSRYDFRSLQDEGKAGVQSKIDEIKAQQGEKKEQKSQAVPEVTHVGDANRRNSGSEKKGLNQ
jgi:hypothetical protein